MADNRFDKFKKATLDALKQVQTPSNMREIGHIAANMVKLRTRLGSGVPRPGSSKERLKPLSESYKLQRAGKLAFFSIGSGPGRTIVPYVPEGRKKKLSPLTSAGKSNLTFTGQLLDSIDVISSKTGEVTIGPKGERDDGLSNSDVAKFVTDAGRPFNSLSDVEGKRLREYVAQLINIFAKKMSLTK